MPADTRWQTCSICKTIPDRSRAFWKGGEQQENNLTRLSHTAGEKRAQAVLKAIEAHKAWFAEQAPQHIDALRHAPREPERLKAADTIRITLCVYGRQNWQSLQTLRKHLRDTGLDRDPVLASAPVACAKMLRANCRICRNLPVSGASDEQWVRRLSPDQADVLQPFLESLPNHAEDMAFYVGELGQRMPLALLCAFDDDDKPVRALAYRCLARSLASPQAKAVLDEFLRDDVRKP